MEFAPLPANHFGHIGMPQSPFDMLHMSNVLPDYPQRYHQSQHHAQTTRPSAIDSSFAFVPFANQQFTSQLANQYQSQYPQSLASHYRSMAGHGTNTTRSVAELHASSGLVFSQQQPSSYSVAMSQQPHHPNFLGQQSTPYGSAGMLSSYTRPSMVHQPPRLQAENPQMNPNFRGPSQYPEGE